MSDKERKSVTLDPENKQFLDNEDNASAVVNRLVENYRVHGDAGTAALELQRQHREEQLKSARQDVEMYERHLAEVEERMRKYEKQENAELEKARDALAKTPKEPDNPAVTTWANKLGMTPGELLDRL